MNDLRTILESVLRAPDVDAVMDAIPDGAVLVTVETLAEAMYAVEDLDATWNAAHPDVRALYLDDARDYLMAVSR